MLVTAAAVAAVVVVVVTVVKLEQISRRNIYKA